jgi:RNA polymerase sigma-70 factor (ECF subfamily)
MYRVALNTAITMTKRRTMLQDNQEIPVVPYESDLAKVISEDIKILYGAIDQLNKVEKGIILLWLEKKLFGDCCLTLYLSQPSGYRLSCCAYCFPAAWV